MLHGFDSQKKDSNLLLVLFHVAECILICINDDELVLEECHLGTHREVLCQIVQGRNRVGNVGLHYPITLKKLATNNACRKKSVDNRYPNN